MMPPLELIHTCQYPGKRGFSFQYKLIILRDITLFIQYNYFCINYEFVTIIIRVDANIIIKVDAITTIRVDLQRIREGSNL